MPVRKRVAEHYDKYRNDNFVMIGLQGSQNYDLAMPHSDVDTKMLVVPTLSQIIRNSQPISTTKVLENDEHCDIKDVRLYWSCLRKQHINFVELLFTDYFLVDYRYYDIWQRLVHNREAIARYHPHTAVKCMRGMAYEKYKALSHPYPSKLEVIHTYGYDPKQLHHILRLEEFMEKYITGYSYELCLRQSDQKDYLRQVKVNGAGLSKVQAHHRADLAIERMEEMTEYYYKNFEVGPVEHTEQLLDETLEEIITISLKAELSS